MIYVSLTLEFSIQHFNMAKLYNVDCGPCKFGVSEYNGYKFVADVFYEGHDHAKMKEHMDALEQMEIREDDVILLTYPKSGTHLVREICQMLQVGRVEYITDDLDFPIEYRNVNELANLKSPRTMHTHIWYHMLPKQLLEGKRGKIIAVFRNPKDVIVSFWHFMAKRFEEKLPIDIFAKLLISDRLICNSWYAWRKFLLQGKQQDEHVQVLSVKFEDVLHNPKDEISRIAKFLGQEVSEDFIDEISKACEISNMRKEKIKSLPDDVGKFFKDGYEAFYRKGSIGDWQTDLPEDVNEVLDKWIASQEDDGSDEFPTYKAFYKEH